MSRKGTQSSPKGYRYRLERDWLLAARDPEPLLGVAPGIEALGAHEGLSRRLDAPEPGQGEGFHAAFGRVVRQELPVAVVGQQMKRVQLVT